MRLTGKDFFGKIVWVGGTDQERCERLYEYEEAALRRAEPENRVLTLEKLKEHCKGGVGAEPLWIEFREGQDFSRWVLANAPAAVFDFPLVTEWLKSKRSVSDYLKRWRCWLRRPSAEEMEREKWEKWEK